MKKLTVLDKKANVEGIATELESGRFEVTVNNESKEVAASTFKRWYKVLGEVQEEVKAPEQTEEAKAPQHTVETAEVTLGDDEEESKLSLVGTADFYATKKGEGRTVRGEYYIKLEGMFSLAITEYDNYVNAVKVVDIDSGATLYQSAKMSIKDALENADLGEYEMAQVKKAVMQFKRHLKASSFI